LTVSQDFDSQSHNSEELPAPRDGYTSEGPEPRGRRSRTIRPTRNMRERIRPMMELVTGTFARRGERSAFGPLHPLNLLWQAFADEVASGDPFSL
jgi:hypothetical protein